MRFNHLSLIILGLALTNRGTALPTEPTEGNIPYPPPCNDRDFSNSSYIDSEPINCLEDFSSINRESAPTIDFWELSNLTSILIEPNNITDDYNYTSSADSAPSYSNEATSSIQRRSPKKKKASETLANNTLPLRLPHRLQRQPAQMVFPRRLHAQPLRPKRPLNGSAEEIRQHLQTPQRMEDPAHKMGQHARYEERRRQRRQQQRRHLFLHHASRPDGRTQDL
ncbi:hypothetical protein IFR05_014892 [Cadophora sp. M221]|nr:hypothetical protein IFR05_014892 [Cadophora sp. M221]